MTKTTNYQLNQWDAADPIRREDFNADNAAIDAAFMEVTAAIPKIFVGSYVGTGVYGKDHPNTLAFDFAPKLVVMCGMDNNSNDYLFVAVRGVEQCKDWAYGSTKEMVYLTWDGTSLSWYSNSSVYAQLNQQGAVYRYFAAE